MKPAIEGGEPTRKDFLVFGRPDIQQPEIDEITDTLRSGWLGTGPKVKKFQEQFSAYQGINHSVGLFSCTSGLFLSLKVLNLPIGSEVISSDFTFTATVATIIQNGLTPVLIDVMPKYQTIEYNKIEQAITPKTKAMVIVAFAGLPCEMDPIIDIARRYNLHLILDNAHAIESEYKGKKLAQLGDISNYSFYSTKNLSTGEGGMVCSNNKEIIDHIQMLALHGLSADAAQRFSKSGFKHYDVVEFGYKMNMTDLTASLGIHQLNRLDANWIKRKNVWDKYVKELSDLPIYLPHPTPDYMKHAYHLFTIQLKLDRYKVNRDYILSAIQNEGIGVGIHYRAIHQHRAYAQTFGWTDKDFPNATWLSERTISLPIEPNLTEQDTDDVIEAVRKVLLYYRK